MIGTSRFDDWDAYADCYDCLTELRPYAQMLEDVAGSLRNAVSPILDAGCGTGNLTRLLPRDVLMVGTDASSAMLARAVQKCRNAIFVRAGLDRELQFCDEQFGGIACVNVLYALPDPENALREFFRVLRPDGILCIATPKREFENGLILKAHCQSKRPDTYWMHIHRSPERENLLVREAMEDEELASRFLKVTAFNRRIAADRMFRFFTEQELRNIVTSAGFRVTVVKDTYAAQSHLLIARVNMVNR